MPSLCRQATSTTTDDGWKLRGELVRREGVEPVSVVVLGHAMMADRRTMDRRGRGLATAWAERGFAVFNFDLRGHGESGPSARDGARWRYDDFVLYDIPALVAAARAEFPSARVTLVGHSLAGHAALISAGLLPRSAPDAIVGLAPNLWSPRFDTSVRARLRKGVTLAAWGAATAAFGRFDSQRFGLGTAAEPWPYVRQFLHFYFHGRLESADGTHDYLEALRLASLPVLAVSSEGDRFFAHPPSVARFVGTMSRAQVTHRVISAQDLDPPPNHMGLVTNPRCRQVWREIGDWIEGGVVPSPRAR